jgi:tetratricopeptide (TPR) repeat protein
MLEPGRHRLEVRFAAFGGDAELSVMVVPASEGRGARRGAEARAAPEGPPPPLPGGAPVPSPVVTETPSPGPAALVAAGALARAYVADRHGAAERAWRAAVELEGYGRFAIGLALAATLARDDPGRPGGLARDRARPLVRAALAIDPTLARVRHALAVIALEDERPREALDEAAAAAEAAPGWWIPELTLHAAFRLRGLGWDADRALDRASRLGPGACPVLAAALSRAEDRREAAAEARLHAALSACGPDADERVAWLRRRGDLPGAEAALRLALALRPDRAGTKLDLAEVLVAQDRAAEAAVLLAATVDARDGDGQIRLADAQASAGDRTGARATIAAALRTRPDLPEVRRAARALGLPLPLDPFRVDGRQVIRAFEAAGRTYAAPAVVVLDRTVTRVFPDGAEMTLTHNIVRVQSKDGIDKWGEVEVPDGAEILALRTHKRDGSTREPEEFAGKDAVSAVDLAIGDYVEWETLETDPPRDGLGDPAAGGGPTFMGERFYFQSFDAPLDRSEYLVVTTAEAADRLRVDARAGAPAPTRSSGVEGTVVTTFAASGVAQLFPERSSVAAVDHIPSVRVSSGVTWASWSRFLREQLYGTTRSAPVLRDVAAALRARAGGAASPAALAAAATAWVAQNVEPDSDLRDPASFAAARGRGNRVAVLLALGQELGLPVRPVLARSRLVAEATAPTPTEEADDFAEPLVAFDVAPGEAAYVYPPLKHAPFGYLPPGLDGARILELGSGAFRIARGRVDDHRAVDLAIRLDGQGGGAAEAVEALRGWPALEWAELVDRWGGDRTRLRQDFEQRWLGIHFPGAVLKELEVEILGPDGKRTLPRVTGAALPLAYTASEVKLRYSFTSSRLALRRDREMRLLPTFFRSQPGRRFATEPQRRTALLLGSDIPLGLRVRVELPPAARIVEPPRDARGVVVGKLGGYRFTEERRLERRADGGPVLVLERESALPIMRVAPSEYPAVADELRRVDALEQQEIRIGLPPGGAP